MIDLHFHSKCSDWKINNSEIISIAKGKKAKLLACTDHDFVNDEFVHLARNNWIKTCFATEISAYDPKYEQSLHLTCYARNLNSRVRKILSQTRVARVDKNKAKIKKLQTSWFIIDEKKFFDYYDKLWVNTDNINIHHIAHYIYLEDKNRKLIKQITWIETDSTFFIQNFLKRKGQFSQYWFVKMAEYEPIIEDCTNGIKENSWIISLAHPNNNLTIQEFENRIPYYIQSWLNAIEINSMASAEWVNTIQKYKEKYWYIITLWSDCHFEDTKDGKHAEFGELNWFVSKKLKNQYIEEFREYLEIV